MLHDRVSIPALTYFGTWAIAWAGIQMAVYTVLGQYRAYSEDVKRHCEGRCKSKLDRMRVRAIRPLMIKAGEAYYVGRGTALGVILIVTDVTVNAIFII